MQRVLVVQNSEEGPGHLGRALRGMSVELRFVRAHEGEAVPMQLDHEEGLLVMGGPPSVHEPASGPWMADVMRLIRHAHARHAPILGICLGAQLLAAALGGRTLRGPWPEVGFEPVRLTPWARDDPLLRAFHDVVPAFHLHHDTYTLPPGAVRLAHSSRYEEQAFRVGPASHGLQFHPEMDLDTLRAVLPAERDDLDALGLDVEALLREAESWAPDLEEASRRLARGWVGLGEEGSPGETAGRRR